MSATLRLVRDVPERIVHVLMGGLPMCMFSTDVPANWPQEHRWISVMARDWYASITCARCREKANAYWRKQAR